MRKTRITVPPVLRAEQVVRRLESDPAAPLNRNDAAALRKLVEQHYTLIGVLTLVQTEVSASSKQHIVKALKQAGAPAQ